MYQKNPEILIFDEVTNYLDTNNEEKVLKTYQRTKQEKSQSF